MFTRFLDWNLRHPWFGIIVAVLVSIAGMVGGREIPIQLSLVGLLPETRESVRDFKEVSAEVGGVGYLGIIFGPVGNTLKPEVHFPELARKLQTIPDVRYVFYERETYALRKKALYILPRKQFSDLMWGSDVLLSEAKRGTIFDLDLQDESERESDQAKARSIFDDIRKEHLNNAVKLDGDEQRFFYSKDQKYIVVWVKPSFDSEDIGHSKKFNAEIREAVSSVIPTSEPYELWGRSINQVRETEQVNKDIALTSFVSLGGIALVLIWGLGTLRGALMTVLCVTLSMGWTLGFAHLVVGQINVITGFLLAILSGLGVEYGVHLIRRYYQELKAGLPQEQALRTTYHHTGRALLSAALTSSGAFLLLSFSDFRGFSELGKIAGFGILAIFSVYGLGFPAIAAILRREQRFGKSVEWFGFYPFNTKWTWLMIMPALFACLVFGLTRAYFEFDFDKMRIVPKRTHELNVLVDKINDGRSLTPAALLPATLDQADHLQTWLEENDDRKTLHSVISQRTLIPKDSEARWKRMQNLKKQMGKISDKEIEKRTGLTGDTVRQWLSQPPYTIEDLPLQLRDILGKSGNVLLVYTKENLSHGEGVRAFSSYLNRAKKAHPGMKIGSDVVIFNEILDHVVNDGRIVMLLFLVGAFFVMWLDFRSLREAVMLEAQLIFGISVLVALMGLFGVPFTIFNVAMIPAVLAAGIDMGVHVRHRELESGEDAITSARFVSQAVHLGALTSIIGFGALFLAQGNILKGIAWISALGQVSMYLICMFVWPLLKTVLRGHLLEDEEDFFEEIRAPKRT